MFSTGYVVVQMAYQNLGTITMQFRRVDIMPNIYYVYAREYIAWRSIFCLSRCYNRVGLEREVVIMKVLTKNTKSLTLINYLESTSL